MELKRICVLGGSGFVGSHLIEMLCEQRYQVCVPTRRRERAKHLILLPTVDVIEADVHDEGQLLQLVSGMDAVINLVGVLHDARGNRGFHAAHLELTRKVLAACEKAAVHRYVHMSALGADREGPSRYLRTKGEAEALVQASKLDWTIFRPSVIFGRGDSFLNLFAGLQSVFPVLPLGSPNARFKPVFAGDVAQAFVRSLTDRSSYRQSYDLCGPRVYTLRELVRLAGAFSGHARPIIGLGKGLSYLQALAMELLPGTLMSRDNYHSMKVDNVSEAPLPFGVTPTSIESQAPAYLGGVTPRARYNDFRDLGRHTTAR